jgi:hypothetical protein
MMNNPESNALVGGRSPQVVEAERLGQGVFITFDNGEFGFFSAVLLYEVLPRIEKLDVELAGWPGL